MKHSPTWRPIVSRLVFVLILLMPIALTTSRSELVQASPPAGSVKQSDPPIDNALSGEAIPIPASPITTLEREPGNPDTTPPGPVRVQAIEDAPAGLIPEVQQVPNPDSPIDLSLPENAGLTATPGEAPAQLPSELAPADLALDQTLGISVSETTEESPNGLLTGLTGNLDDFNRVNGPLGNAWTNKLPGITIDNSLARTSFGATDWAMSIHNGIGVNEAMARVQITGSGVVQYAGFAFNYADGEDFIFIKIQDNNKDGLFDFGACYKDGFAGFGLGFFPLSSTFTAATLHVSVRADRSVVIELIDLAGGGANQKYVCTGAPAVNGSQFGIISFGGGQIDDVTVEAVDPKPFTSFADQDGPLGSDWYVQAGSFEIQQQKASSRNVYPNLATYNSLGANQIEADISLSPGGGVQYAGLVLNYDEGVNNLFIKVQDNDGDGDFEKAACYTGNNGSSFGLGIFDLDAPFSSAHMKVMVNCDREVFFSLTQIDGGATYQSYICSGAPVAEGYGVGIASFGGGRIDNFQIVQDFGDNFNRANGSLGTDWGVLDGGFAIVNKKAVGTAGNARAVYNGIGANRIEADVSLSPGVVSQYSALMLDYGEGTNNLFIKVQDNGAGGSFNTAGCYLGNNFNGFGPGFFTLSAPFTTAHMIVSVDEARVVTLVFTNIDGGDSTQAYVCGVAPSAEGPFVGIGSWQGGVIDNVRVNRVFGLDSFNRPTGSLGPAWETKDGVMGIVDQTARGPLASSSLTVFKNITGNEVEGDIAVNPSGVLNFAAFILNYGAGVDNLFIKFQNQDSDPAFESIACYLGNNNSGRPFGLGYSSLISPVNSAHVKIWVNSARTVTILLTRINGMLGSQLYTCTGAPPAEGNLVGIASYGDARVDNVIASEFVPTLDIFLPVILR